MSLLSAKSARLEWFVFSTSTMPTISQSYISSQSLLLVLGLSGLFKPLPIFSVVLTTLSVVFDVLELSTLSVSAVSVRELFEFLLILSALLSTLFVMSTMPI